MIEAKGCEVSYPAPLRMARQTDKYSFNFFKRIFQFGSSQFLINLCNLNN